MRVLAAVIMLLMPCAGYAQNLVLGMSKDEIGITAFFDGSEILVFGAVKHEHPIAQDADFDVVIAISSPRHPVTVRRKERRFGIWVNVDAVEIDLAPHFYAVASTGPLSDVLNDVDDLRHHITIPQMIRLVGAPMDVENATDFSQAVERIRTGQGLYQVLEHAVTLDQNTLFSTSITLPANLIEGAYDARIFLTTDGQVVAQTQTKIDVRKVGVEAWLYNLSRQRPAVYGLLSLAIAIFAGWAASAAFRLARG